MKIHKYKNYAEYVKSQKSANMKKSSNVWAKEENIKFLAEYIRKRYWLHEVIFGLCHGTRGGHEQKWFGDYLDISFVVGTEIGKTSAFSTIQWDFNKQNPEWINKFDFIYSNSFDHAFNPENTLNIWAEQVKPGGIIILEYDKRNEHTGEISKPANKTDPVSITLNELIEMIPKWIKGKVIDVLDMPIVTKEWRKSIIIEVK